MASVISIGDQQIKRLQSVQNVAVQLVTSARTSTSATDHIPGSEFVWDFHQCTDIFKSCAAHNTVSTDGRFVRSSGLDIHKLVREH